MELDFDFPLIRLRCLNLTEDEFSAITPVLIADTTEGFGPSTAKKFILLFVQESWPIEAELKWISYDQEKHFQIFSIRDVILITSLFPILICI